MKRKRITLCLLSLACLSPGLVQGQITVTVTGGSAVGTGGSVSYTVGQVAFSMITGTTGTVVQGVQQPFEISTVTGIEDTEKITLDFTVYPNPTAGLIRLVIGSTDLENFSFKLFNMNGRLVQYKQIKEVETLISFDNLPASIYFLKVINDNLEVKVFKIIKK